MGHSLGQIYLHVVFSTKNRHPFLQDAEVREKTHAYMVGTCRNLRSPSLIVGGVADHVHILCRLSRDLSAAVLVRELKRESSKWLKEQSADLAAFYWQNGYGAFSISPAHVEQLKEYIANQEEHHGPRHTRTNSGVSWRSTRSSTTNDTCGTDLTCLYPEVGFQARGRRFQERTAGTDPSLRRVRFTRACHRWRKPEPGLVQR